MESPLTVLVVSFTLVVVDFVDRQRASIMILKLKAQNAGAGSDDGGRRRKWAARERKKGDEIDTDATVTGGDTGSRKRKNQLPVRT